MQVSLETTGPVDRRLTVGVPKERIEPEIQKRLQKLSRTAKVNGFRPGKIPLRVVEQKFGEQLRYEVLTEVLQTSFQEALQTENLRLASDPTFDVSDTEHPELGFSYTAVFKVHPEIKNLIVEGIPVEKPVASVCDADIDTMVEKLRQQRVNWQEVNTPATMGDRVFISFDGTIDGQSFEGNQVKKLPLILGKNEYQLPGLEEELVGVVAGEHREIDLTFPVEHKNPQLAGQSVHFKIQIHSVANPQLPEVNVEFAKSLGVEDGSLETLRRDARDNMARELEYAIKTKVKQQILDGLLAANPIYAPENLVAQEAERLLKNALSNLPKPALKFVTADTFKPEAEKRVKLGILVSELVKRNQIQVPPEQVRRMVERIASTYEDPDTLINWYYADQQRLSEIQSMVLEDQVVVWLLERALFSEQPSDFYTVMSPLSPSSHPLHG